MSITSRENHEHYVLTWFSNSRCYPRHQGHFLGTWAILKLSWHESAKQQQNNAKQNCMHILYDVMYLMQLSGHDCDVEFE